MPVTSERQKLRPDTKVRLLTIEHRTAGTFRITNSINNPDDTVTFDGHSYTPLRFTVSGLSAQGSKLPRPTLTIDNIKREWYSRIAQHDELGGAKVTYKEVYAQNLDDGSDPNTNDPVSSYQFEINQLKSMTRPKVVFQLRTSGDREAAKSGRLCLKNQCPYKTYRVADTASDTFIQGLCPYTGSSYFKRDGSPTSDWREDECAQTRPACVLRYGESVAIPFLGFPGIGAKD